MIRRGWFNESWRHRMSANGIKTKSPLYLAAKTESVFEPSSQESTASGGDARSSGKRPRSLTSSERALREAQARRKLEVELREQAAAATAEGQRLQKIQAGRLDVKELQEALKAPQQEGERKFLGGLVSVGQKKLSPTQEAQQAALAEQLVKRAEAGLPVDPELKKLVPEVIQTRITAQEELNKRESESAFKRGAREATRGLVTGTEEGVRVGAEGVGSAFFEGLRVGEGLEDTKPFPFAGWDNVVFGAQEDGRLGKQKFKGALNPFSGEPESTPGLSSAIIPKEKFKLLDDDTTFREVDLPFTKKVQREVDSLHQNKDKLGKTDVRPFKKGERAFEKGDREGLISALTELEFQVETQRDRWNLIEQTRARIESQENRRTAMEEKDGLFSLGLSGGSRLADQTRKINEVKREVKEGADLAKSRAENLRAKLRRMDAVAPRESTLPGQEIRVFGGKGDGTGVKEFFDPSDDVKYFLGVNGGNGQ